MKNDTTIVPTNRSIEAMQTALVHHGATGVLYEYEKGTGRIAALRFRLPVKEQDLSCSLPVQWHNCQRVLEIQQVRRWDDEEDVYRVAWRNRRAWVLAQLALYETEILEMPQVFLPFATDAKGQTLYEHAQANPRWLLGDGKEGRSPNSSGHRIRASHSYDRAVQR
jgi:hypothetical protein